MKKDQLYQPVGQRGDDDVLGCDSGPYQDDPTHEIAAHGLPDDHQQQQQQHSPLGRPLQRSNSTPNRQEDDPLQRSGDLNTLRRRMGGLSREGSQEKIVVLEGLSSHLDGHQQNHQGGGSISSPARPSKLSYDKNSNTEVSSASDGEDRHDDDDSHSEGGGEGNGSQGEDGSGLFSTSHGSSFDLLDDEDEINLQRYHRDFGTSPFDSMGWEVERSIMENSANMYHPRTESHGSHSKDPWIRMVAQSNQQSPTNARQMSIYSVHSISDLLLYLQGVRRQARQRRAQRLLTMPSEQWWERFQFCFFTYCWDATDVGLLLIAIMLVVWFAGLLWLARINARNSDAINTRQNGAEYNGNAEFDGYEEEGRSWRLMFQWWWRGLGFVLLVRILGPFAVQNVNNRRRERRRQRFMSGNMQEQQRRMQQQQFPTMVHATTNGGAQGLSLPSSSPQDDSLSGVEITSTTIPTDQVLPDVASPMVMA